MSALRRPTRARRLAAHVGWRLERVDAQPVYELLRESQWWPPERVEALQLGALRELVDAAGQVPFWRERLREAGLEGGVRSLDDLRALPPLDRAEVQLAGPERLARPGARGRIVTTSGATGRPIEVLATPDSTRWWIANARRYADCLGIQAGDRRVVVYSNPAHRDLRGRLQRTADVLVNTTVVAGRDLFDDAALGALARSLRRRPPALVRGVTEGLYLLARYLLDEQRPVQARACWSGGNRLYDGYRQVIEAAFGCRVYDRYSSYEAGAIAFECPEAGQLHVAAESVLVELVRDDGTPATPGELGHVLVTVLRNHGMPLLRYRLGDVVVAPPTAECPCGRGLPLLGTLAGRANSLLRTSGNGWLVPARVAKVMWNEAGSVLEFRVVQGADLRLDVKVVQREDPAAEPARARIAAELDALLGDAGLTRVERVGALAGEPGQKVTHIVSHAEGVIT